MTSFQSLLTALGTNRKSKDDLKSPLNVRVDEETLAELNALEAFLQGHGFREASRSTIVRAAIDSYLDGVRSEIPEALVPPTRLSKV